MGALLANVTTPTPLRPLDPEPDDGELLAALDPAQPARARRALAELYARHAAGVLVFLERMLGDRAAAEDALHDVFLKVARHGRSRSGGSVRAWMLRIAANRVADERRARDRRRARERRVARPEAADGRGDPADDLGLESALGQIPGPQRAALELRFGQNLTHAEVAMTLGVSLRTAKDWSRRGLEALRALLEQE